jgi:hypothetical protein
MREAALRLTTETFVSIIRAFIGMTFKTFSTLFAVTQLRKEFAYGGARVDPYVGIAASFVSAAAAKEMNTSRDAVRVGRVGEITCVPKRTTSL